MTWEFTSDEINASGGTSKTAGVIVDDYSNNPRGTYEDTIIFKAGRRLHSTQKTPPI